MERVLKVHLDPGHYGSKYNRSTTNHNYYESAMTWKLTNYLKEELEKNNVIVSLSRSDINENPSLYKRGYGAKGCDLFLSIHSNACNTESVDHPVVYRGFNKTEAHNLALKLSTVIQETMDTVQEGRVRTRQSNKTGKEYYGVLRGASEAGLVYFYIVEHSFHTNSKSTDWLLNDDNLRNLARKEVEVILQYFNVQTVPTTKVEDKEGNKESAECAGQKPNIEKAECADNETIIWNKLMQHFNNPYGVAGLMGNIKAESNFRSNNLQNSYEKKLGMTDDEYTLAVDNGTYTNFIYDKAGYGLVQSTFWSRKKALYEFMKQRGKSIGDLNCQIDFVIDELKGYKTVYNTILKATSIKEASDIVLTQYEKPADQSDKVKEKRAGFGQEVFDKFNSFTPFRVKIKADRLNIRTGPSTDHKIAGVITDHGVYTIIGTNPEGTWGLLKSKKGWISIRPAYVERK